MAERGERRGPGRFNPSGKEGLKELGVTEKQSHNWQKLGAMDDEAFEAKTEVVKKRMVCTADATAAKKSREELAREKKLRRDEIARLAASNDPSSRAYEIYHAHCIDALKLDECSGLRDLRSSGLPKRMSTT